MQNPLSGFFKAVYNKVLTLGAEWQMQKAVSERDKAAAAFRALNDVEMSKIDKELDSKEPFDIAMAKYAHRIKAKHVQNPTSEYERASANLAGKKEAVDELSEKLAKLRGDKTSDAVSANNHEGRGFMAAIGRFVFGRLFASSRAEAASNHDHLVNKEGFGEEEKRLWKLKQHEKLIRDGTEKLETAHTLGTKKAYNHEEAMYLYESTYGNDPDGATAKHFQDAAKLRARQTADTRERHDRDFFPQLYGNHTGISRSKVDYLMAPEKTGGLQKLDSAEVRGSLAQMYMFSKGYSIDEIYMDSPEARAQRIKCGRELRGILASRPSEIGVMLSAISKKIADSPMPDMTSDLAIYKNMPEIDFYSSAGLNFRKIMPYSEGNLKNRDNALGYYNFSAGFDRMNAERYDKIFQSCEAISANGVTGRIALMRCGGYAPGGSIVSMTRDEMIGAQHYTARKDEIKRLYPQGETWYLSKDRSRESFDSFKDAKRELGLTEQGKFREMLSKNIKENELGQIREGMPEAENEIRKREESVREAANLRKNPPDPNQIVSVDANLEVRSKKSERSPQSSTSSQHESEKQSPHTREYVR